MTSISIITPAYNEEEIIAGSLKETFESCNNLFDDIEYIVVNDGSNDNTKQLIKKATQNNPVFKLIDKQNGGFGSAIKEGLKHCTKEYIICVPADSPLNLETVKKLSPLIEEKKDELIITFRRRKSGYSLIMLFNSFLYHKVVSALFCIWLKDYNWIHVYKREVFKDIEIQSQGIFMLAEVLIKARNKGFKIREIEVEQKQRVTGIATITKPSAIYKTFLEMMKFRLSRR
jgi:glycosyltransferase involved in cell wall biosynthesis